MLSSKSKFAPVVVHQVIKEGEKRIVVPAKGSFRRVVVGYSLHTKKLEGLNDEIKVEITTAFLELEQIKQGKVQPQTLNDFLYELANSPDGDL